MFFCAACWCVSESGRGWFGSIAEDPEAGEGAVVATYCPPCAARELDAKPRDHEYV
jgi:hypothetical protein